MTESTEKERFDACLLLYRNKNNSGAAFKKWKKLQIDRGLAKTIYLAIQAQNRYRDEKEKANREGFVAPWRLFSTWLNQEGWLDEIASHSALREGQEHTGTCECGKTTLGPKFKHCATCYSIQYGSSTQMIDNHIKKQGYQHKTMDELRYICRKKLRMILFGNSNYK